MQPTASDIGIWVMCLTSLAGLAANLITMFNAGRTQKRRVSMEENTATVTQVNRVESDLVKLKDQIVANGETRKTAIEAKVEELRKEVKTDTTFLQAKIGDVATQVSGLETQANVMLQDLCRLGDKIDRLAERGK